MLRSRPRFAQLWYNNAAHPAHLANPANPAESCRGSVSASGTSTIKLASQRASASEPACQRASFAISLVGRGNGSSSFQTRNGKSILDLGRIADGVALLGCKILGIEHRVVRHGLISISKSIPSRAALNQSLFGSTILGSQRAQTTQG